MTAIPETDNPIVLQEQLSDESRVISTYRLHEGDYVLVERVFQVTLPERPDMWVQHQRFGFAAQGASMTVTHTTYSLDGAAIDQERYEEPPTVLVDRLAAATSANGAVTIGRALSRW